MNLLDFDIFPQQIIKPPISITLSPTVENYQSMKLVAALLSRRTFFTLFLCNVHAPPPSSSQPFLGCMTLSWRSPMLLRAFTKKPRKETSKRALKALTRLPPRIRMANSSLFSPPSQFFSRSSGVQSIETKCMTVGEAEEYELNKLSSWQNPC